MLRGWFGQSWVTVLTPTIHPTLLAIEPLSTTKKLEKCGFRSGAETYIRTISFKMCVQLHRSESLPFKEKLIKRYMHQGGSFHLSLSSDHGQEVVCESNPSLMHVDMYVWTHTCTYNVFIRTTRAHSV